MTAVKTRLRNARLRNNRVLALLAALAALLSALLPTAASAAWPDHSVSILVPTAAGGNTDLMARLAAEHLSKSLGQPFVVLNKPSAGGVITSNEVGHAEPDGYTVLFAPSAITVLTPMVQKLAFDPEKLLVPVTNVGTGVQMIAIRASLPANTLPEFLAYARANPGKLNFAIAGTNNISHLGPILLFKRAGVDLAMVPSRGEPQAITDLLAGSVDFYFGNAGVLLNSDREKIRILAVSTPQRLTIVPDLPTIAETVPGVVFQSWNGFYVPVGTPAEIVSTLRARVTEMVAAPEMRKRLLDLGIVPGGQSAEEVAEVFRRDRENFAEAVAAAGITKP